MNKILAFFVVAVFIACSAKVTGPTQADVDRVASKYPGYTLAELNEGKTAYEQKCGTCHELKKVKAYTEEQWNKLVPGMVKKANKKTENIDARTQELIQKYVNTMCSK